MRFFIARLCCISMWSLALLPGCSKGGAGDPSRCGTMNDTSGKGPSDRPISRSLYAELKTPRGSFVTVPLDGIGGVYAGNKQLSKCDERGRYTIERFVLVNTKQELVAVANRVSAAFRLEYASGQTTLVSDASVASHFFDFNTTVANGAVTLLKIETSSPQAKQGERLDVHVQLQGDECGLLKSQWWLAESSGALANRQPIDSQPTLVGGSGTVSLLVPVDASASTYYIEGQVTTKNGQTLRVKRKSAAASSYDLFDEKSGIYTPTSFPVQKILVLENPDADRVGPQAVQMDAQPSRVERCQLVSFSLKLSDDRGLPTSQTVRSLLMLDDRLVANLEMSGGDVLSGGFVIPSDAPGGVWYAYPEFVRDAAGNEGRASFAGGKFTLSGLGITPKAVQAATFIVPGSPPDPTGKPDLGTTQPDLGALPVELKELKVLPTNVTRDGDAVSVQVTWKDLTGLLK